MIGIPISTSNLGEAVAPGRHGGLGRLLLGGLGGRGAERSAAAAAKSTRSTHNKRANSGSDGRPWLERTAGQKRMEMWVPMQKF